jgi:hypothetical protein
MISKHEIREAINRLEIKSFYSKHHDLKFDLWDTDNIDKYNETYDIDEIIPGYYGIGSNGGEELLIVEMESGIVYSVPFIPMDDSERIEILKSINELKK